MNLTPDQLSQLRSLGLDISTPIVTSSLVKGRNEEGLKTPGTELNKVVPLLSISGLTLLSLGGLILFKTKTDSPTIISPVSNFSAPTPTQVPKSIQHYLLASQQYFTQALQSQQATDQTQLASLLNQSILSATSAIKEFPADYRGYEQRGRIYQSLLQSQPQLLSAAIADFAQAHTLNPDSVDLVHTLASLYAQKGDAQNTLAYLGQTVVLEPTRAQNFYDLAKLQQQIGLIPQAIDTYTRLLTIVADPAQKQAVESEKLALENLVKQAPATSSTTPSPGVRDLPSNISLPDNPSLIQASTDTGLIIASPETAKNITVTNQTDSNSLSGTATLPSGQSSITIDNSKLTPNSQVYVVATQGGKNLPLRVLSKSDASFSVGLATPTTEDIVFKWWIIN